MLSISQMKKLRAKRVKECARRSTENQFQGLDLKPASERMLGMMYSGRNLGVQGDKSGSDKELPAELGLTLGF